MNITQIESNVQQLISAYQPDTFIYDLLLAYGQPKASIKRLQIGSLNLAKQLGEIAWKKKLYYREVPSGEDVAAELAELRTDTAATKHDPRFIVVTDHAILAAYDRKTQEGIQCTLAELPKHYAFFLPWAGMEKFQAPSENPADVKAAEKMARLYDEIRKDNPADTPEAVHSLNVFLSRLLFCFFAEDTGIFDKGQFTNAIGSHTQADGSDLHGYLDRLFNILNTAERPADLPTYLWDFPYVNGGLFRDRHHAPVFTRRSRQAVIDSGKEDWSAINPDIFGSMIQAVVTPEHRGGLGMHYTSVPNIMKVIEPLFLDELHGEYEAALGNPKKLNALLTRIQRIKLFDPACGSGNFLIIAYKELRRLEMKIFRSLNTLALPNISLSNFYGIELDDFAHEVAILSLWLAEHQMNQEFFREFGRSKPSLPLTGAGRIVHGNACRLDWEKVCPKQEGDEVYILGNPPYLGSSMQSDEQKADLKLLFQSFDNYKNLDYIACWFIKGANYINGFNAKYAFVSTNSICQGEQVSMLWPHILDQNLEIGFAFRSFKWTNSAKSNAGVIVVIIGLRNTSVNSPIYLFDGLLKRKVPNINPYLSVGNSVFINRRNSSISQFPLMVKGNQPTDDGNFILNFDEKIQLETEYPESTHYIYKLIGSDELINGKERWCLWIKDDEVEKVSDIQTIQDRINRVGVFRKKSIAASTRNFSGGNHRFIQIQHEPCSAIIIPKVSSERRDYIPMGFLNDDTVITDLAFAVYDSPTYLFSILTSRLHMAWVKTVAGRLKTDYRYSNTLCYNTFPFPPISDAQKQELEKHVYTILAEREAHSEKTLAQLYDPDKMPAGLREAHRQNDLAVERCYRSRPFESDEERLEYLFKLYEQMVAREQEKGTLFEGSGKKKKPGTLIKE
jgi:hypothetical protein